MKTRLFRLNFSMRTASRAACYSALLAALTMIFAFVGTDLLKPVLLANGQPAIKRIRPGNQHTMIPTSW